MVNDKQNLSSGAKALVGEAFSGIENHWVDCHVHLAAIGDPLSGFINPKMQSYFHPFERIRFEIYRRGAGIQDLKQANEQYIARLLDLVRSMPFKGKVHLLALDQFYTPDGKENLKNTVLYVSNEYVWQVSQQYPDIFVPVVSIHPYRQDAVEQLNDWHRKGVQYVKWLPNAMGFDPSSPLVDDYYRTLKNLNMILLTHAGIEHAVEAKEFQYCGNPLLLRRALKLGVKVIIAHAASLGKCEDLDDKNHAMVTCFDLFLRLMDNPEFKTNLFADLSAITFKNRSPHVVATLLERTDLHPRLINGSDYPLPAINAVIWTKDMVKNGFITAEERLHLNEIYAHNPLLFDFVLKRTLKSPSTKQKFPASIFKGLIDE